MSYGNGVFGCAFLRIVSEDKFSKDIRSTFACRDNNPIVARLHCYRL